MSGQADAVDCPLGTYNDGSTALTCISCPIGMTTPDLASTSIKSCLSPTPNFVFGFIALAATVILLVIYVVKGRFRDLAFLRRSRFELEQIKKYAEVNSALIDYEFHLRVESKRRQVKALYERVSDKVPGYPQRFGLWLLIVARLLIFLALSAVVMSAVAAIHFSVDLGSILFKSLIIWRRLKDIRYYFLKLAYPNVLRLLFAKLEFVLKDLHYALASFVSLLLVPVEAVLEFLDSINIADVFKQLNVTCLGSTAPIELTMNLCVLGLVVVVIESKYQLFRGLVVRSVSLSFFKTILSPEHFHENFSEKFWKKSKKEFCGWFGDAPFKALFFAVKQCLLIVASYLVQFALDNVLDFQGILQYAVLFVSIGRFTADNGFHAFTPACNKVPEVPYLDAVLAKLSTIVFYLAIMPAVYELANILCPGLPSKRKNDDEEIEGLYNDLHVDAKNGDAKAWIQNELKIISAKRSQHHASQRHHYAPPSQTEVSLNGKKELKRQLTKQLNEKYHKRLKDPSYFCWYFQTSDLNTRGPFNFREMNDFVKDKKIGPETKVRRSTWKSYFKLKLSGVKRKENGVHEFNFDDNEFQPDSLKRNSFVDPILLKLFWKILGFLRGLFTFLAPDIILSHFSNSWLGLMRKTVTESIILKQEILERLLKIFPEDEQILEKYKTQANIIFWHCEHDEFLEPAKLPDFQKDQLLSCKVTDSDFSVKFRALETLVESFKDNKLKQEVQKTSQGMENALQLDDTVDIDNFRIEHRKRLERGYDPLGDVLLRKLRDTHKYGAFIDSSDKKPRASFWSIMYCFCFGKNVDDEKKDGKSRAMSARDEDVVFLLRGFNEHEDAYTKRLTAIDSYLRQNTFRRPNEKIGGWNQPDLYPKVDDCLSRNQSWFCASCLSAKNLAKPLNIKELADFEVKVAQSEASGTLPSYWKLCVEESIECGVADDEIWLSSIFVILPLGHLCTRVGRNNWAKVLQKFFLFFITACGIWTPAALEAYRVDEEIAEFTSGMAGTYQEETLSDVNAKYSAYLDAVIAPRAILLQLVPGLVLFAQYASATAAYSVFFYEDFWKFLGFSSETVEDAERGDESSMGSGFCAKLYPLLAVPVVKAGGRVKKAEDVRYRDHKWMRYLRAFHIFFTESRVILFAKAAYSVLVAFLVLYYPDSDKLVNSVVAIILPYAYIKSIIAVIHLGKIMQISDLHFSLGVLIDRVEAPEEKAIKICNYLKIDADNVKDLVVESLFASEDDKNKALVKLIVKAEKCMKWLHYSKEKKHGAFKQCHELAARSIRAKQPDPNSDDTAEFNRQFVGQVTVLVAELLLDSLNMSRNELNSPKYYDRSKGWSFDSVAKLVQALTIPFKLLTDAMKENPSLSMGMYQTSTLRGFGELGYSNAPPPTGAFSPFDVRHVLKGGRQRFTNSVFGAKQPQPPAPESRTGAPLQGRVPIIQGAYSDPSGPRSWARPWQIPFPTLSQLYRGAHAPAPLPSQSTHASFHQSEAPAAVLRPHTEDSIVLKPPASSRAASARFFFTLENAAQGDDSGKVAHSASRPQAGESDAGRHNTGVPVKPNRRATTNLTPGAKMSAGLRPALELVTRPSSGRLNPHHSTHQPHQRWLGAAGSQLSNQLNPLSTVGRKGARYRAGDQVYEKPDAGLSAL